MEKTVFSANGTGTTGHPCANKTKQTNKMNLDRDFRTFKKPTHGLWEWELGRTEEDKEGKIGTTLIE